MDNDKRFRYIYCITNMINGKNYFGQHTMRKGYKSPLADMYWGSGTLLKRAQKKYGLENFKKEIICSGLWTKQELNKYEICTIATAKLIGKAEYNILPGGEGFDSAAAKYANSHVDIKARQLKVKQSLAKKSIEERKAAVQKGLKTKELNGTDAGAYWRGKHHTEDTKRKMKESALKQKRSGSKNGSYGKSWWTNGEENVKAEVCPVGFWKGRTTNVYIQCIETSEKGNYSFWKEKGFSREWLEACIREGKPYKTFHFCKV